MSTYIFECPCGKQMQTQAPAAAIACPECRREWVIEWDSEIQKAAQQ